MWRLDLDVLLIRRLQLRRLRYAIMYKDTISKPELVGSRHVHRLVEQKRRVEVVADARAAVPRRGMTRVLRVIEHRDAAGQLLAAVELAGQVAPVGDLGRGPVTGGAV